MPGEDGPRSPGENRHGLSPPANPYAYFGSGEPGASSPWTMPPIVALMLMILFLPAMMLLYLLVSGGLAWFDPTGGEAGLR